ncbi:AI-2E family transporter [Microbacterium sp. C7(2022)]|uniref:AI-2E family transporter n=1 Tax=Microbacterium sp. C7(2022) TaxID=2992759 RepID=UPI00237BEAF6|nr:AI-2E family transporter [Microbacterium sp. C7(2022)]MDE0547465.1 AI-2E family transporter [Microbacterium sp. C7(2022)]
MGLFRSTPKAVRLDLTGAELVPPHSPSRLWSDGLGRFATRSLQVIIIVIVVAGIAWAVQSLTLVTIPLSIALILAAAFAPAMKWMRERGVPALLATIIALLTAVGLLTGVGWLIVWAVRDQWDELYTQAVEGFRQLLDWVNTLPFAPTDTQLHEWGDQILGYITSAQFGSSAVAGVSAVASFLTGFVLMVVVLFFFLKDGPRMWEFLLRPFHGEHYQRARRIGTKTVITLGSYIRGTATIALVDAIGILIGLLILDVPLAIPLAVLVFLLAFIPIVGATIAGTLAVLVALVANDWINALLVLAVILLVQQLEGNFLQPVVMARSMKLHAFVVLVALTAGTIIGGVLGAVLAVPVAATVWGIIQVWDGDNKPAVWARPKRREAELT